VERFCGSFRKTIAALNCQVQLFSCIFSLPSRTISTIPAELILRSTPLTSRGGFLGTTLSFLNVFLAASLYLVDSDTSRH